MTITSRFALLFALFFAVSLIYFIDVKTGKLTVHFSQRSFVHAPKQPLRNPAYKIEKDCFICE